MLLAPRLACIPLIRATQGKGNEQFLAALRDLLATTCNMMSMDCPEGELVAPKAVSHPWDTDYRTFSPISTASTSNAVPSSNISTAALCNEY